MLRHPTRTARPQRHRSETRRHRLPTGDQVPPDPEPGVWARRLGARATGGDDRDSEGGDEGVCACGAGTVS